jgi:hypothetical protein
MKSILVLAASFVALVALAQEGRPHDRKPIDVQVINGEILVPEDHAHTNKDEGALVWRISATGYEFPPTDGIVVDSQGKHTCGPGVDPQTFRCKKNGHAQGESYKYTVKVVDSASHQTSTQDPWIVND